MQPADSQRTQAPVPRWHHSYFIHSRGLSRPVGCAGTEILGQSDSILLQNWGGLFVQLTIQAHLKQRPLPDAVYPSFDFTLSQNNQAIDLIRFLVFRSKSSFINPISRSPSFSFALLTRNVMLKIEKMSRDERAKRNY